MAFLCCSSTARGGSAVGSLETDQFGPVLVVGNAHKLLVAETSPDVSITVLTISGDSSPILCAAVSSSGRCLAASNDKKTLMVWRSGGGGGTTGWLALGSRVLQKRATVLCFTKDEDSVLVGDRTGEVFHYLLDDMEKPGGHLLGHFSMMLDMVLSPSNKHVITCDRDEKIRVSRFPNSYNIEAFCLAHTDFVTSLCLFPNRPHLLVSGSGDGCVKVWEWERGRLVSSQQVGQRDQEGEVVSAVTKVSCSSCEPPAVAVAVENSCQVYVYLVSSAGDLSPPDGSNPLQIQLPVPPWDIEFDRLDRLWLCLGQQSEPLMCFQWRGDKQLVKVTETELPILSQLSKWEYFDGGQARDLSMMRKQLVDNMSQYLARKEERLKAKNVAATTNTTCDDKDAPTDDDNGGNDDSEPLEFKKPKLEL